VESAASRFSEADERLGRFRRDNIEALIESEQAAAQEAAARIRQALQDVAAAAADYERALVAIEQHAHATPGGYGARAERDERVEQLLRSADAALLTDIQIPYLSPATLERIRGDE
jgi:hypothetical protein